MKIKLMTELDRKKLTVMPRESVLEKRIKRLENNILVTAKAYRQIGMIQVAEDIEVLVN